MVAGPAALVATATGNNASLGQGVRGAGVAVDGWRWLRAFGASNSEEELAWWGGWVGALETPSWLWSRREPWLPPRDLFLLLGILEPLYCAASFK